MRTLTQLDEWPRHQTLDTFGSVASDSPMWSDGSWICVGDPEGRCHLITALRFYPNTNVADGYAIVTLDDGKQYNLRVSRRLRPAHDDLSCGPLWMDIVQGLRTIRFGALPNDSGIEFDLLWDGASPCFDETPGVRRYQDGRIVRARSNYTQVGHVSGTITVHGRRFEVGPSWVGARDHSWGVGDTGTGNQPSVAAPPADVTDYAGAQVRDFGLRQFCFVRFPGRTVTYRFHAGVDGTMSHVNSCVDYPYGSGREAWSYSRLALDDVTFVDGLPRVATSRVSFTRPDGGVERFEIRNVSGPVYMQGGGYWDGFTDGRGRGAYRGESVLEHDVWDVRHPTVVRDAAGEVVPQRNGAWAETIAIWTNLDDPSEVGIGEFEAVVGGPYPGVTDQENA
jgi:hypothetical protein